MCSRQHVLCQGGRCSVIAHTNHRRPVITHQPSYTSFWLALIYRSFQTRYKNLHFGPPLTVTQRRSNVPLTLFVDSFMHVGFGCKILRMWFSAHSAFSPNLHIGMDKCQSYCALFPNTFIATCSWCLTMPLSLHCLTETLKTVPLRHSNACRRKRPAKRKIMPANKCGEWCAIY